MKLLLATLVLIFFAVPSSAQYSNFQFENNRGVSGSEAQPFAPGNTNSPRYDPYASTYGNPYSDTYGPRDRRRP